MRHGVVGQLSLLARRILRRPHGVASLRGSVGDDALWQIMARYCAHEIAPADVERIIKARYGADPEVERVRRGLVRITAVSRQVRTEYRRQAAWQQLVQRIETAERGSHQSVPPLMIGGVAAPRRRRPRRVLLLVGGVAALLLVSVVVQRYGRLAIPDWNHSPAPRDYVASRGERVKLELPDGSSVTLGPESQLRVTDGNFARSRVVRLDGLAHFSIAHDPAHPFLVYAGGAAVQAVGTAFTVRAYREDAAAEVVVTDGRVLLRSASASDGRVTVLDPGDLGRREAGGVVSVSHHVDLIRYAGWLEGRLVYDHTPAREVARELARWYDLVIQIDDTALADTRVNGFFDSNRSSEQALRLFASVLGATYERHGSTVVLQRGEGQ